MHIHLPKPLHGWREFVGEVGVIVIGVLIALGAEQVVERARWAREVRDARAAIHREMTFDLAFSPTESVSHRASTDISKKLRR